MRLPRYRLQPVLDAKVKAKEEAEKNLVEAQDKLCKEQEKWMSLKTEHQKLVRKKQGAREEIKKKLNEGKMTVQQMQSHLSYLQRLGGEIAEADRKVAKQEENVEMAQKEMKEAKRSLTQAAKEAQVMEKHKERWLEKIKKQALKKEQKEMDEIGTSTYLTRL